MLEFWGERESCAAIAVEECGDFGAAGTFANFCLCVPFQPCYPARVCGGGEFFASCFRTVNKPVIKA